MRTVETQPEHLRGQICCPIDAIVAMHPRSDEVEAVVTTYHYARQRHPRPDDGECTTEDELGCCCADYREHLQQPG
jgi:hypothetical protein